MPKPAIPLQPHGTLQQIGRYITVADTHLSRFKEHVRAWGNRPLLVASSNGRLGSSTIGCTKCDLCSGRRNVVLYRGNIPCDVLFVGEAPGESEDSIGVPFIGPAGNLLRSMMFQAYGSLHPGYCIEATVGHVGNARGHVAFGITNVVACIPRNPVEVGTGEIRQPDKQEVDACKPRLLEIITLADPKAVILLGDVARRFFPKRYFNDNHPGRWNGEAHQLVHPARILHLQEEAPSQAMLLEKRFVMQLSTILRSL